MGIIDVYKYAEDNDISIYYLPLGQTAISLPCGCIGIDPKYESVELLAHEIGHIKACAFYTEESDDASKRKAEADAIRRAIEMLIPREDFYDFVRGEYITPWVLADYFDISEEFAQRVITYYKTTNQSHISDKRNIRTN